MRIAASLAELRTLRRQGVVEIHPQLEEVPSVPGDIADLTATALSSSEVQLAFANATGAASHQYRINGGAPATLAGNKRVTGLTAETEYDFEVRGVNTTGGGNWSNVATETTEAAGAEYTVKPLVWTNLARPPDSVSSALSSERNFRSRVLHLTAFDASRIRVAFYPWAKPGAEVVQPVPYTILECALEINGGYVPITFNAGSASTIVDPDDGDLILSDWMEPGSLVGGTPLTEFPKDAEVFIRFKANLPVGCVMPKGALGKGQSQQQHLYDPAEEADSGEVYATGLYAETPASATAPTGNIGIPALLIGDPIEPTAKAAIVVGTSIAHGWADSAWGSGGLVNKAGYGFPDRATVDPSNQNVLALVHSTQPGERLNAWLSRANRTWSLFEYVNIVIDEHGGNDLGNGTSAAIDEATRRADKLEFWRLCREAGVPYIISCPILPRTNSSNTAPLSGLWTTGGAADQDNAWLETQLGVGNGPDAIVPFRPIAERSGDPDLWILDSSAPDGYHPGNAMHSALALALRTTWLEAEINGGSTVITGPTVVSQPTISGTPNVGSTLTRDTQGTYSATPTGRTGQWRADSAPIDGATGTTYVIQAGDLGKSIDYLETATFATGDPVVNDSLNIGPIQASGAPTNTVLPVISGGTEVGDTLTATTGTWTGSPTDYDYQWYDDALIADADEATYELLSAQVGKLITVQVTATNASGSAEAMSDPVGPVTAVAGGPFAEDTLTPASAANEALVTGGHVSESGHTWVKHPSTTSGVIAISAAGRTYLTTAHPAINYINAVPPSADYRVKGTIRRDTSTAGTNIFVVGRLDSTVVTCYAADITNTTGDVRLLKFVNNTTTVLGTYDGPVMTNGEEKDLELEMIGNVIKVYVGGVERISFTDTAPDAITAAGYAGIRYSNATQAAGVGAGFTYFSATAA